MEQDIMNQRVVRVIHYLLEQNIVNKKSELAERLDCSPQTITEILGGRQGVKVSLLQKLFDRFDVSYNFIFRGEGEILNHPTEKEPTPESDCNPSCNPDCNEPTIFLPNSGKTIGTKKAIADIPLKYDKNAISIPMVDISVAAGAGYFNTAYLDEIEYMHMPQYMLKGNRQYLCVRIKGISMVPTLQDGGYLIVSLLDRSEWQTIRDGHIYIVTDREGRAFVKRLKNRLQAHGFLICNSDNPDKMGFPSFNLSEEEINSVWYAEWYFTPKMPNINDTYYNKIGELEENYNELREDFHILKSELNKLSRSK